MNQWFNLKLVVLFFVLLKYCLNPQLISAFFLTNCLLPRSIFSSKSSKNLFGKHHTHIIKNILFIHCSGYPWNCMIIWREYDFVGFILLIDGLFIDCCWTIPLNKSTKRYLFKLAPCIHSSDASIYMYQL